MNAILVRIGIDHAYGGWNAPVDPISGRFLFVPIPEKPQEFHPGCARLYDEVEAPLTTFLQGCGVAAPADRFPLARLLGAPMHLDPDFEHLTYGDVGTKRGSHIRQLDTGDALVFYAGLRSVRPGDRELVYAVVGLFVVEEVVSAEEVGPERFHENAHTRKVRRGSEDIVVRARPSESGRCARCVPIGELRDRAYRVRRNLLEEWGGLSVRDGYIQRSARPPRFLDASRFMAWWRRQDVPLVRSNSGS